MGFRWCCVPIWLLACTSICQGISDVFQRTDSQKEIELGRSGYEQFVALNLISRNEAYIRRVQRVLDQLQTSLPVKMYPYQAVVITDQTFNARCYPGGYMVVFEGLLARLNQDEALAFVLAHEMGHAIRRHWVRISRKQQTDATIDILGIILSNNQYVIPDRTMTYMAYSRENEYEADAFAVELYLRSGFDSKKVDTAAQYMADQDAKSGASKEQEYMRSHPASAKRLERVREIATKLIKEGFIPTCAEQPSKVSLESVFGKIPSMAALGNILTPLSSGSRWTYRVGEGRVSTTYEVKVIGIADVLTSKVARVESKVGESAVVCQMLADESGLFRRNRPDRESSKWVAEVAFPTANSCTELDGVRYSHIATETIDCPAGKYENCICLSIEGKGKKLKAWYAPNVGLVKRVNELAGVTELLIHFRPGS